MALAREHYRAAGLALPRLPLAAILAFAVAGMGGSVFLAFSSFNHGPAQYSFAAAQDVPVYSVRGVPFDRPVENAAERAHSVAQALSATAPDARRSSAAFDVNDGAPSAAPTLIADNHQLRGFPGASAFMGGNTYLALAGSNVGISAQVAPSGYAAPDAESLTAAPVPEASTWLCGAALMLLVGGRGAHARWRRNRHRG